MRRWHPIDIQQRGNLIQRFIMAPLEPEQQAQTILNQFLDRLDDARVRKQYSARFVDLEIDVLTRLLHQALGTSPLLLENLMHIRRQARL